MKKLVFLSFVALSLGSVSENAHGMFNFFRGRQEAPQNTDSRAVVTQAELSEKERVNEGHKDDMRNQAEMYNNQIGDLTAQISRLTMFVQNLNDKVTTLTEQNEAQQAKIDTLKAEKNALNQQIADFKNSTEQKQLEEVKRANDLKQQELAEAKRLEADKLARNKKLTEELAKLEKERDDWSGYLDGRKTVVAKNYSSFGWSNQRELDDFYNHKKEAPGRIAAIDQKIATLRAQFEK